MPDRADFHIDGPFDHEQRLTYFGTELNLAGWAILPDSDCRLAVYARGRLLGCVTPTESRTDLRAVFPWLGADLTPGFKTTLPLPAGLAEADPNLRIRIALERGGRVLRDGHWAIAKGIPRLELHVDETRIADGRLVCDQRNVRFYGWAVCQETIEGITADLGENCRIIAQYGITRPDVFTVRPNNPNGAAAGFSLFVPVMPPDCDSVVFSVLLSGGTVLTRRFELAIQPEAVPVPTFRRLPFAETHFLSRGLATATPRPCFVILPRETVPDPTDDPAGDSIASILASRSHGAQPNILVHADCAATGAATRVFRSGAELSRALRELTAQAADEWIICLREGDTISDSLCLFLHAREQAGKTFVYWDETAASGRRARTVYKVPGAPFLTLLTHDFIGRGWAARITGALLDGLAAGDVAQYLLSVPLAAFQDPPACAHIPETLSRHVYTGDGPALGAAGIAARNRVLATLSSLYGPLSLERPPFAPDPRRAAPGAQLTLDCDDAELPRISVIIPTIGTAGRVINCLRGLREQTDYPNLEIIVIDHMPFTPEFLALKRQVRGYADQVLPMIGTFNWSRFNNVGAALATGTVFLFLNDDVEMRDPQWLRRLLPYLSQPSVGAVGPRLLTPQGDVQSCGVSLFDGEGAARNDFAFTGAETAIGDGLNLAPRNCTSLLGAAILTRREIFTAMGGFEEALALTFNDLDYHMKLREAGLQVAVVPASSLIHFEKTSRALIEEKTLEALYDRKWRRQHLLGDPYVHPACETGSGMYKINREPGEILWNRNIAAPRGDVRRILVMRLDHIGDFTLTVPAFRLLRETFPDARIDAIVGPWNVALAERAKLFDRVMPFNFYHERSGDGRGLDEEASRQMFRERIAGQAYDLAIDMRLDGDTRLLLTLVEARFRAGFSQGLLHPWLDISLEWAGNLRSWRKNASVADEMRRLVMAVADRFPLAAALNENHWHPDATPAAPASPHDAAARPVRRVIIHPFAGNEIKMWPAGKWRDLVALLHEDGVGVLMIGSARDAIREADTAERLTRAGAVNALGVYAPEELPGVIASADCFVGCDSGPKHLAASTGIPVVGLQSGFVDPVMWGPMNLSGISLVRNVHCAPCYIDDAAKCPRQVDCMTQITVADVYRQVSRILALSEPLQTAGGPVPADAADRCQPPPSPRAEAKPRPRRRAGL